MTTKTQDAPNGAGAAEAEVQSQAMAAPAVTVWERLRAPFPPDRIGILPRATKKENPKGHCDVCSKWHGLPAVHLDYVGHADVTDRLLDVDPEWTWEPVAFDPDGQPAFVRGEGGRPVGLWIRLTVAGVSRLGFGSVESDKFDPEKQLIGDALRNAAMRFGVALDLWKKDAERDLDAEPADTSKPGVDRPYREGDACPACIEQNVQRRGRFQIAKGGPRAGQLQCTGSNGEKADGKANFCNHAAPPDPPAAAGDGVTAAARESDHPAVTKPRAERVGNCAICAEEGLVSNSGSSPLLFRDIATGRVKCNGKREDGTYANHGAAADPNDVDPTEIPW